MKTEVNFYGFFTVQFIIEHDQLKNNFNYLEYYLQLAEQSLGSGSYKTTFLPNSDLVISPDPCAWLPTRFNQSIIQTLNEHSALFIHLYSFQIYTREIISQEDIRREIDQLFRISGEITGARVNHIHINGGDIHADQN